MSNNNGPKINQQRMRKFMETLLSYYGLKNSEVSGFDLRSDLSLWAKVNGKWKTYKPIKPVTFADINREIKKTFEK